MRLRWRTVGGWLACAVGALACSQGDPTGMRDAGPSADGSVSALIDAGPAWAPWASQAKCLASTGEQVIRDGDGDGVIGVWLVGCGGEQQQGTKLSNMDDCDDTDPSVSKKGFRDADGDRWTLAEAECFATLPAGYAALRSVTSDCDDTSAAVQEIAYLDADHDGSGAPKSGRCAAVGRLGVVPSGLSPNDSDCDDGSAAIHPGAFEQWNDGVDSDCDEHEGPLDCQGTGGACGCELLAVTSVPVDAACTSSDLFVVALHTCTYCYGYNAVTVGNQGTQAVVGGFDVELADGTSLHIAEDLAPGAVSHPFLVIGSVPTITLTGLAADCNVKNDQATLPDPSGLCDP